MELVGSKTILEEMLPRRDNFSQLSGCQTSVDRPLQGRQCLQEDVQCDDAFVRRLKSVRNDHLKKVERCQKDLEAYNNAKKNHPTPALNIRGEPQWHGSAAQNFLKESVEAGQHKEVEPKELWESKPEYQVYALKTFRDHIYQEGRLRKFSHYVDLLKKKKIDELQY